MVVQSCHQEAGALLQHYYTLKTQNRGVVSLSSDRAQRDAPKRRRVRASFIAAEYDVTDRHVYKLAEAGVIPSIRFGKTVRFDPEAVRKALEK